MKLITSYLRIKEWDTYQHYKDRDAKWLKLYTKTLDSQAWIMSDDATRALMLALLMLAAKDGNKVGWHPDLIRQRAHLNQLPDITSLIAADFLEVIDIEGAPKELEIVVTPVVTPASKLLAGCYQVASPEEKREEKKRKEKPSRPAVQDERHRPLRDFIERCCEHAKVPFAWDGSEAKALASWLGSIGASVPLDSCMDLIRARFRSEDAPAGERPRLWLPHLSKYANGPLNTYGRPKEVATNAKSKQTIQYADIREMLKGREPLPHAGDEPTRLP